MDKKDFGTDTSFISKFTVPCQHPQDLAKCATDDARALITYQDAINNVILPIGIVTLDNSLSILVATDKIDEQQSKLVKFLTNRQPYLVQMEKSVVQEAIFIAYHRDHSMVEEKLIELKKKFNLEPIRQVRLPNPLRNVDSLENDFLCSLLDYSVAWDATDLHIRPNEKGLVISIRVKGNVHTRDTQVRNMVLYDRILQRLKILSNLDVTKHQVPQEGTFAIPLINGAVNARVSIIPTVNGETLAIRFFKKSGVFFLSAIGFEPDIEGEIRNLIQLSSGAIIVCGATGAGKTTTLYAIARELITQNKRILSIEDPVEVIVQGMTQVQVSPDKKISFAGGLKAILRQDPDVIFIGEIRDEEVAKTMIQAALSGHLVLATMHAGCVEEAKLRLLDWGVSSTQIELAVKGIIHQKLVFAGEESQVAASIH